MNIRFEIKKNAHKHKYSNLKDITSFFLNLHRLQYFNIIGLVVILLRLLFLFQNQETFKWNQS